MNMSLFVFVGVVLGAILVLSFPSEAQSTSIPDLAVERLLISPVEPEPGARVELVATISNRGQTRITASFSVYFELDGKSLSLRQITTRLERGRQVDVKLLWTAVEGEHVLRVQVDPFDEISETDETNNKLTTRVEVRKIEGIRSITLSLQESVAQGLQKTGQAFQIPPNNDLIKVLSGFQTSLGTARDELSASAERLSALKRVLSPNLSTESQIEASDQTAALYRSLADAFGKAVAGIQKLNPTPLLDAFEKVRISLLSLAAISIEGISLSGVSAAVPLMEQGLQKAKQLQAALTGTKGIDVNGVVRDLLALLSQVGMILIHVGDDVIQLGKEKAAQFTDGGGQPVVHYQPGQDLRISAPGSLRLKLEVFDLTGQALVTSEAQTEQLIWKGTSADGKALSPGRYFYRLTIQASTGNSRVELGELTLSP